MHTDRYTGNMSGMNASYSDMGSIKENIETKNESLMPNDLYDDMRRLNALYEELMWSNDDELQFIIENGRIVILNKTHEEYIKKTH